MGNVLLVSAHPDDMEIGMGGTTVKLVEAGDSLTSLVLTDGRRSPNPFRLNPEDLVALRKEEAKQAAGVLGIRDVIFCDLSEIKTEANYESCRRQVKAVLSDLRPVEVFTLHPELDRHPSHRLSGKLIVETIVELQLLLTTVWAYEVWGLFPSWDRFEDISNYIGRKLQAIREHKSQIAAIPYGEGVMGLNRWRGTFADPEQKTPVAVFAEVFVLLSGSASQTAGK